MNIIGIIPARLKSKQLPNKPLIDIHGMPMIGHVYHRSKRCKDLSEVYVTTCDREIFDYIDGIGGKVILTSDKHETPTERVAEAMLKIEKETKLKMDIAVMIKGDEPMVTPEMIGNAVSPLIDDSSISAVSLMSEITKIEEFDDPHIIKVVVDMNNHALYFSREPIPTRKKGAAGFPMLKQVSVLPFRRKLLVAYGKMYPSPMELVESIDILRIIENGFKVKMVMTETETYSVNTQSSYENVLNLMKEDKLIGKYLTPLN